MTIRSDMCARNQFPKGITFREHNVVHCGIPHRYSHRFQNKRNFFYFQQMFEEFNCGQQDKHGFILFPTLLHPKSVGSIRLKSQNPFDYPLIDPEYLEDEQDVAILLDGNVT